MRIIEWNCQGAFRRKNKEIFELKADIWVILECEQEEKLRFGTLTPQPNDFFWYGDTGKKGIGIFSYSKYKFKILKEFNPKFRYILPLEVTDGTNTFLLFAVWAMDDKHNPLNRYIGQVWLAIEYYRPLLNQNSLIVGDFNSNKIWDSKIDRVANHSDVVNSLKLNWIESLYHKQYNEEQGKEKLKTFFMYRNILKPYHIDYIFASNAMVKNGYNLSLETCDRWIDKSDHVPMLLDIIDFESNVDISLSYGEFIDKHLEILTPTTTEQFKLHISKIKWLALNIGNEGSEQGERDDISWNLEILKEIDLLTQKLK